MRDRLFGLETEYAFSATAADGRAASRADTLEALVQLAGGRLACLPGAASPGLFLANGARFYLDAGLHPEMATPECGNPWDVVRYALAGDRILERLAAEMVATRGDLAEIVLTRCNVDYAGSGSTWGAHESQAYRADPAMVALEIVPHLVSRVVYTGAGGFDNLSNGLEFLLSPRVAHLTAERSSSSTSDRGIFHTKDEALGGGGLHRLHVICGESNGSRLATWLKFGTTALVLALVDAGFAPGRAVRLKSSLRAMREIARDPSCRLRVPLFGGGDATAIEIQRHYLAQAEAHRGADFMPQWAGEVCRVWRETLERLGQAPDAVATRLDWAVKLALFQRHVERRGHRWDALVRWNPIVAKLGTALERSSYPGSSITAEELLGPHGPIEDTVASLAADLRKAKLSWDGLRPFLDVKKELYEIDVRYTQLGERGIYRALDRAGVLDDHVDGIEDVESAIDVPPAFGRARLRGEAIRALAGRRSCAAEWQRVYDDAGRSLDLRDPFATRAAWVSGGRTPNPQGRSEDLAI